MLCRRQNYFPIHIRSNVSIWMRYVALQATGLPNHSLITQMITFPHVVAFALQCSIESCFPGEIKIVRWCGERLGFMRTVCNSVISCLNLLTVFTEGCGGNPAYTACQEDDTSPYNVDLPNISVVDVSKLDVFLWSFHVVKSSLIDLCMTQDTKIYCLVHISNLRRDGTMLNNCKWWRILQKAKNVNVFAHWH